MTPELIAFWSFFTITVLAAVGVISLKNPVHAVLSLVLTFFTTACLWLLLQAEFLGVTLILVYVGAVMVLFLFVVMMLDIDFAELRAGFIKNVPLGLMLAVVLVAELVLGIGAYRAGAVKLGTPNGTAPVSEVPNIEAIGGLLYTKYIFLFESAGLILLVAMVGAIVLTHRRSHSAKAQNIDSQNRRRPQDATRNVDQPVGQGVEL